MNIEEKKKLGIGRLWGHKLYECGQMDYVSVEIATTWRDDIDKFLYKLGCVPLNPCNKPINNIDNEIENKNFRKELKIAGKYDELSKLVRKNIRQPDLRLTDLADALIVYLDTDFHATGSYEEIFLCNRRKIPIMVVCKQGVNGIPDWLYGVLNFQLFFNTWNELKQYLIKVNDWDYQLETYNRWVFIDYYSLYEPLLKDIKLNKFVDLVRSS